MSQTRNSGEIRGLTLAVLLLIALCPACLTTARGQGLPRLQIATPADLREALGTYDARAGFPRTALIAMQGRQVIPWLAAIIADEAGSMDRRRVAVATLGFTRDSSVVDLLIQLAGDTAALRLEAQNALTKFPYPSVCDFWAERLEDKDRTTRYNAIRGLALCNGMYREPIERIAASTDDWLIKEATDFALENLSRPQVQRTQIGLFAGAPRSDGVYVPSDSIADLIRRRVCEDGCPAVLRPDFFSEPRRR